MGSTCRGEDSAAGGDERADAKVCDSRGRGRGRGGEQEGQVMYTVTSGIHELLRRYGPMLLYYERRKLLEVYNA